MQPIFLRELIEISMRKYERGNSFTLSPPLSFALHRFVFSQRERNPRYSLHHLFPAFLPNSRSSVQRAQKRRRLFFPRQDLGLISHYLICISIPSSLAEHEAIFLPRNCAIVAIKTIRIVYGRGAGGSCISQERDEVIKAVKQNNIIIFQ